MCSPFEYNPKPRHNFPVFSDGFDPVQDWINKRNAEKHKKNMEMKTSVNIQKMSINDLISKYTLAELKVHAKQINLKGVSNLNKSDLAKKIFDSASNDSN